MRAEFEIADGRISGIRFGDPALAPRLVFLHAAGFNANAYKSLLEPLGVPSLALDLRGHGYSQGFDLDPMAIRSFHIFADDVKQIFDRYIDQPVVLAGHSLGAATAILTAPHIKDKLTGYVGLDPVCLPMHLHRFMGTALGRKVVRSHFPLSKMAGRRRREFESRKAIFERYQGRGTFKGVSDAALNNYLDGAVEPYNDGVRLKCAPKWEQAVYAAQGHNIFKAALALPQNSKIHFAGKFPASTVSSRRKLSRVIGDDKISFYENKDHFFPLTEEGFAIAALKTGLAGG